MTATSSQIPEKRPLRKKENAAGYTLSLAGWIIQIVSGFLAVFSSLPGLQGFSYQSFMFERMIDGNYPSMMFGSPFGIATYNVLVAYWITFYLLAVAIGAIGVALVGSNYRNKILIGASLVLFSALIAYPTVWGFGIGSAVMIVGSIMSFMTVFQFMD